MSGVDRLLPNGWVREFDANYNHYFWVDTLASPPRSIWVHPFEDGQYLKEHFEVAEKLRRGSPPPPEYLEPQPGPHPNRPLSPRVQPVAALDAPVGNNESTSFVKKLKRLSGLGQNRDSRSSWRWDESRQPPPPSYAYATPPPVGTQSHPMSSNPPPGQPAYPSNYQQYPPQGYGGYGPPPTQYYQAQPPQRRGRMGGSMLPLLGGLGAGFLLGDLIGGGFDGGDGGFDGGGDFGGGF